MEKYAIKTEKVIIHYTWMENYYYTVREESDLGATVRRDLTARPAARKIILCPGSYERISNIKRLALCYLIIILC